MELTATNHGDDTGATIALTGNSGTARLWLSSFAGSNADRDWQDVGAITGNGELELADLNTGPYTVFAMNGSGASRPLSFRVTDGAEALHWRCMEAVREFMLGLALPHVSANPDDHALMKMPYRADLTLSLDREIKEFCAIYFPKAESVRDADNESNEIDYGVQLLLIRKTGKQLTKGLPSLLKIRELLTAGFTISPFPDLQEIHTVNVQPGSVVLPEQWKLSYDCTTVVFRCLTEQPAGIF